VHWHLWSEEWAKCKSACMRACECLWVRVKVRECDDWKHDPQKSFFIENWGQITSKNSLSIQCLFLSFILLVFICFFLLDKIVVAATKSTELRIFLNFVWRFNLLWYSFHVKFDQCKQKSKAQLKKHQFTTLKCKWNFTILIC
jgi:hypothetical protein